MTEHNSFQLIDWLMDSAPGISREEATPSLAAFKGLADERAGRFRLPIDRAIAGGFLADRVAYAFAAGYEAALRRLVPGLPDGAVVSLCVTEREGGHPRAIKTRLVEDPSGAFTMTGQKSFITAALESEILVVAASTGTDAEGKNRLKMVLVDRGREGVAVTPMPDLPFVPEISHGIVTFTGVRIDERDVLPGDGYVDYVKPFRTIEDVHVVGAVMGYLARVALVFSWPRETCQGVLALIGAAQALAAADPGSPATHVALAGLTGWFDRFLGDIEPLWDGTDAETRARWTRDRYLLGVAQKAREARLASAWDRYGSNGRTGR